MKFLFTSKVKRSLSIQKNLSKKHNFIFPSKINNATLRHEL